MSVVVGKQAKLWRPRLGQLPRWSRSTRGVYETVDAYVQEFERRRRSTAA